MNIFVGNLPLEITADELREVFMSFGEVTSVSIMNDKYIGSGQPRGYGFLEMPSEFQGQAAIEALNRKMVKDCTLVVIQALPLTDEDDKKLNNGKRVSRFSGRFNRKSRQRKL